MSNQFLQESHDEQGFSVEQLEDQTEVTPLKGVSTVKRTSYEEPPELELKPLPAHLEYAFLTEGSKLPVIINSSLTPDQKQRLVNLLRHHKEAIAW